jgi:hypothetical protein
MMKNNKPQEEILVIGNISAALGIKDKVIAKGICDNPIQLQHDPLSDLLNNPITKCIFCKNGKCYYGGECERRKPLVTEGKDND